MSLTVQTHALYILNRCGLLSVHYFSIKVASKKIILNKEKLEPQMLSVIVCCQRIHFLLCQHKNEGK